jgi:Deoxycytidylate deaminase
MENNIMELILDDEFKQTYEFYYNDLRDKLIMEEVNNIFVTYNIELITDAINIIKTSSTLGLSYTDCSEKIIETILHKFPVNDDIHKFIISLVIKVMIASGTSSFNDLIRASRNIPKEVAAKYFRTTLSKVTDQMISDITAVSDKSAAFGYSITESAINNWDEYFYNICRQVARNSKCLSRRIGALLVRNKSIISTGYNGPPSGVPRCDNRWNIDKDFFDAYNNNIKDNDTKGKCPRHMMGFTSGEGLDICVASHAEVNTILNAAKNGIYTKDSTMYMSCSVPCSNCIKEIINAGIKEIVVLSLKTYDDNAFYLINNSSLEIRLFGFTDIQYKTMLQKRRSTD